MVGVGLLLSLAASIAHPMPVAAEITTSDILRVTDMSGLSVSPDRRWLAFRTSRPDLGSNRYRIGWWIVPTDGTASARQIADGGEMLFGVAGMPEDQTPIWSPASDGILYRALVDGQVQIWRADIAGHAPVPVTQDSANVQDLSLDRDGRTLIYHVGATRDAIGTAETHASDDGILVDQTVDIAQPVLRGGIVDGQAGSQRLTPGWFARGNILWQTPLREVRIQLAAMDEKPPSDVNPLTPRISDDRRTLTVVRPDGKTIPCLAEVCRDARILSAVALKDGSFLVTTADNALNETLSTWRPGSPSAQVLTRSLGALNGGRSLDAPCAVTGSTAFCVAASATRPPQIVAIGLDNGARRQIYDPNAELRNRISAPVRELHWKTKDGIDVSGQLILPTSAKPAGGYPLVINYYACWEFLRGGIGDELPMLPLASHGIGTLCINRVRAPKELGDDHPLAYDHAIDAIEAITKKLSLEGLADRRHMGIWGLSFGSEIAMQASWRLPWLSAAAIATGTVDPDFYWFNTVAGRNTAEQMKQDWRVGDPIHDARGWRRISPAAHVDEIHMPLLMQMSEQEARWSLELYSRLSNSTTPVEMYAFPNEAHIKAQPRHKLAAYDRNLDWFRFWLAQEEDPAAVKAAQYRRWSTLAARAGLSSPFLRMANP